MNTEDNSMQGKIFISHEPDCPEYRKFFQTLTEQKDREKVSAFETQIM